jgi:hypothetical protein
MSLGGTSVDAGCVGTGSSGADGDTAGAAGSIGGWLTAGLGEGSDSSTNSTGVGVPDWDAADGRAVKGRAIANKAP